MKEDKIFHKSCSMCAHFQVDLHEEPCVRCRRSINGHIPVYLNFELDAKRRDSQTAKADEGKLKLTLVPRQIIKDIAKVREYGNKKYGDPENWRTVETQRYREAAFRHFLAYLDDPKGVDDESGLPHLAHLATNIAFLCEMEKGELE